MGWCGRTNRTISHLQLFVADQVQLRTCSSCNWNHCDCETYPAGWYRMAVPSSLGTVERVIGITQRRDCPSHPTIHRLDDDTD